LIKDGRPLTGATLLAGVFSFLLVFLDRLFESQSCKLNVV
jgi:hypothetical protein